VGAAVWLPVAGFFICLFAYHVVESVREGLEVKLCVCGHKQGEHDMTWVNTARLPQDWGRCLKCLCRAFIRAAA
jgi:hypothetical protein